MYISADTPEQTSVRLREVIRAAKFKLYAVPYSFEEVPLAEFRVVADALAIVRDDEVWSYLVPATAASEEPFTLFRFHFPPGLDNSGFVGWLATLIKTEIGTGVFVTCGQNSKEGGIFDYWGCPVAVSAQVVDLINNIRNGNSTAI
ncbi:DUF6196 family protein [Hymenobacter terrenus]|uniref:DUF6196 family protein n=1 Tax=Hymenobacter terrenus TaxID=1629124 RepID=UPI00061939E4|nr:DUF6196 family protein [Hymenobacter terrenus]